MSASEFSDEEETLDQCRTCSGGSFNFQRMTYDRLCIFCVLYLLKEKHSDLTIRNNLLRRLFVLPPQDIEFVMPQLCQMALTFEESFANDMANLLVARSSHFIHFALKLTWWLEAAAFYLDPAAVERGDKLIERIEEVVVRGHGDFILEGETLQPIQFSQHTHDEVNSPSVVLNQRTFVMHNEDLSPEDLKFKQELMNKRLRSEFFTAHLQFFRLLNSISTQLTPLPRPKRKQLLPLCLASIAANGLYFPLYSAFHEHFVIRQIYHDQGIVLNSRDKAPFLLWTKVEYTDKPLLDETIYEQTAVPLIDSSSRQRMEDGLEQSGAEASKTNNNNTDESSTTDPTSPAPSSTSSTGNNGNNNNNNTPQVYDPYGETYDARCGRLLTDADSQNTTLLSVIFKGGDDCRQEVLAMQWISLFDEIFTTAELPLQTRPYGVLVTSHQSGMIETIVNSTSIDGLKKGLPYGMSFPQWFHLYFTKKNMYYQALDNFVESMAAYSLICYFLQIKDRHNGNIMLDNEGRIIHIDFGFMLSSSPGGNMNFENVPFKLTPEYIQIMGGEEGEPFRRFQAHFVRGFLEARKHVHKFLMLADICQDANILAFKIGGKQTLKAFKERFMPQLTETQAVAFAAGLVKESCNHWRSAQYDEYQRFTNGIL